MGKLPRDLSGQQVVKALERAGFYVLHQKGSHIIMRRDQPKTTVSVPGHSHVSVPGHSQLRVGTLRVILHQANLTIAELTELL